MKVLGPLMLGVVVACTAACGDDEGSPVSTTPDQGPFDRGQRTGIVVFSPGNVDSATH